MSPFLSDCPSLMLGIAIHCIQHSQAMLERGVCELAHSFFHFIFSSVCQMQFLLVQLTSAFNIHNGCVLTLNYLLLSLGPHIGFPGCDN